MRSDEGGGPCGGVIHVCIPQVMDNKNGNLASDMVANVEIVLLEKIEFGGRKSQNLHSSTTTT